MAKSSRRPPPSRVKYEQANPTVSCRVPREFYDRLRTVMAGNYMSFSDVLRVGLEFLEPEVARDEEIRKSGHREGYDKAKTLYVVPFACAACGTPIELSSEEAKKAASQYMQEHGWGHAECIKRRR